MSHAALLNVRVCGFYIIQAIPDGDSLEMADGADKQVQWENVVRLCSVCLGGTGTSAVRGTECAGGPSEGGVRVQALLPWLWPHEHAFKEQAHSGPVGRARVPDQGC